MTGYDSDPAGRWEDAWLGGGLLLTILGIIGWVFDWDLTIMFFAFGGLFVVPVIIKFAINDIKRRQWRTILIVSALAVVWLIAVDKHVGGGLFVLTYRDAGATSRLPQGYRI